MNEFWRLRSEPLLLAVALLLPTLGAWLYFFVLADTRWAAPAYGVSKTIQFLLPLFVLPLLLQRKPAPERWPFGRSLAWGLVSGLAGGASLITLWEIVLEQSPLAAAVYPSVVAKMEDFGVAEPLQYLLLAVFLSLAHSGLEEYYWRWFLYRRLRHYLGYRPALVVSSLGFMSHHVLIIAAFLSSLSPARGIVVGGVLSLGVAAGGAFWAWLYERSGTLTAPWLSHVFLDVALMTIGARLFWG